jgi:hypothetical protein
MGCNDYPEPLTAEESRAAQAKIDAIEAAAEARVEGYKTEIRKLIDEGLVASISEITAILMMRHQPSEQEISGAARDILLDREYGMPDDYWRISHGK